MPHHGEHYSLKYINHIRINPEIGTGFTATIPGFNFYKTTLPEALVSVSGMTLRTFPVV